MWLQLLVKLIKADEAACEETSFSLTAQLQAIDLLHVLLPEWTGTAEQQKEFLNQLVDILAEHVLLTKPDVVLEMAHSENRPSLGNFFHQLVLDGKLSVNAFGYFRFRRACS